MNPLIQGFVVFAKSVGFTLAIAAVLFVIDFVWRLCTS